MHIRGFDGLRALAVLLVFITHKTTFGAQGLIGYSGVWMFFLISGFLIGGQLWGARVEVERGRSRVGRELLLFWTRRAFRIFPAYYLMILLVAPYYFLTARDVHGLPFYLSYTSNFYFQAHLADFHTTWAHLWSLAVEEQFYIAFAPLLLLTPSRHAATACLVVIGVSLVERFRMAVGGMPAEMIYIDSFVNFGLLATGSLLFIHRERIAGWVRAGGLGGSLVGIVVGAGLVGVVPFALVVAEGRPILLQALFVGAALLAALLLMNVYANQRSVLVNVLEWRPLAYAGRISYGLYLFNDYVKSDVPERLLKALARMQGTWLDAVAQNGAAFLEPWGLVVCFGLLFVLAHVSWVLVERPALQLRNRVVAALQGRAQPETAVVERVEVEANPAE